MPILPAESAGGGQAEGRGPALSKALLSWPLSFARSRALHPGAQDCARQALGDTG